MCQKQAVFRTVILYLSIHLQSDTDLWGRRLPPLGATPTCIVTKATVSHTDLFKGHQIVYVSEPVCHEYGNAHCLPVYHTHGRNIVNLSCHDAPCEEANYSVVYGVSVKVL